MPINDTTTGRGYQKPNIANLLTEDVGRLRSALDAIDTDMVARYTKTEVDAKLAALINSAPAALDTLNELAAALGNDANFSATVTTALSNRYTKTEVDGLFTGLVNGAPAALNTLSELAAAINNDPAYATTVTTALATKANTADVTTALASKYDSSSLATQAEAEAGTSSTTLMTPERTKQAISASTGTVKLTDGSVSAPSLTFASNQDTGIYRNGSDIDVSLDGVRAFSFGRGTGSTTHQFDVIGSGYGNGGGRYPMRQITNNVPSGTNETGMGDYWRTIVPGGVSAVQSTWLGEFVLSYNSRRSGNPIINGYSWGATVAISTANAERTTNYSVVKRNDFDWSVLGTEIVNGEQQHVAGFSGFSANGPAYFARAWLTIANSGISGSGNISSISVTANGTAVSFTTAMPDMTYAVTITPENQGYSSSDGRVISKNTSSFQFGIYTGSSNIVLSNCSVVVHR